MGKWATYKIPLNPDLATGTAEIVGSIAGGTLTVTGVTPGGVSLQAGGWISGPGVAAGTYLWAWDTGTGETGTYTLGSGIGPGDGSPGTTSQAVASATLKFQRTNMYKFSLIDQTGTNPLVYYVDNIGFTTE